MMLTEGTKKPCKNLSTTTKLQQILFKSKNQIKVLTDKALVAGKDPAVVQVAQSNPLNEMKNCLKCL